MNKCNENKIINEITRFGRTLVSTTTGEVIEKTKTKEELTFNRIYSIYIHLSKNGLFQYSIGEADIEPAVFKNYEKARNDGKKYINNKYKQLNNIYPLETIFECGNIKYWNKFAKNYRRHITSLNR